MAQESNAERQVLAERKDSFTGEASYPVEKLDARPQEPTSHCGSGGKGFLKGGFQGCGGRGGGCVRSIILKLVVQLLDQHHPDRFGYSLSVTPESVCSHFFEASSGNCVRWSGLCHGCSLVIM